MNVESAEVLAVFIYQVLQPFVAPVAAFMVAAVLIVLVVTAFNEIV